MLEDLSDSDVEELASELRLCTGSLVWRLRHAILRDERSVEDELSVPELLALSRLERGAPTTVSRLARAEHITPQGMAATVAGLEKRGLVTRNPDHTDGRRVLLSVTDAGREAMGVKRSAATQLLAKFLVDGFSREELEMLRAAAPLIDRLAESIYD